MNKGQVIKEVISEQNRESNSTYMLSTISQTLSEQLRPTLSYKHLQNSYFLIKARCSQVVPFYMTRVAAGTPFNGDDYDYIEHLDLNEYLTGNSNNIFCIRVEGESMIEAGICDNDILVVDRLVEPTDGRIIIASLNSELTVKRLKQTEDQIILMPANPRYSPIIVDKDIEFKIWGVVVHVIHSLLTEKKDKEEKKIIEQNCSLA